jgi:hypothetical protein
MLPESFLISDIFQRGRIHDATKYNDDLAAVAHRRTCGIWCGAITVFAGAFPHRIFSDARDWIAIA